MLARSVYLVENGIRLRLSLICFSHEYTDLANTVYKLLMHVPIEMYQNKKLEVTDDWIER